jgi:hypothetical protein
VKVFILVDMAWYGKFSYILLRYLQGQEMIKRGGKLSVVISMDGSLKIEQFVFGRKSGFFVVLGPVSNTTHTQSPHLKTPNPRFNPGFIPPFI